MKKTILIVTFILNGIFISCTKNSTEIIFPNSEYIIKRYDDKDGNEADRDWFQVIDIYTRKYQPVPVVKEIDGNFYLATFSRLPSFNNKIVQGEFYIGQVQEMTRPDTLFVVTKHVRDTIYTQTQF